MGVFVNDPFEMIFEVFRELHPEKGCRIFWTDELKADNGEDVCGVTIFPDDGSRPCVYVNANVPVCHATEILAHELAHVAVGIEDEHGAAWEQAFEAIHAAYCKRIGMQV